MARPVTAYQNLDKLSDAWVQALPGPKTGLSASVFVEAMAARLCLHSPAVVASGMIGRPLGRSRATIDPFDDSVMCCRDLVGDTWRQRHVLVKVAIGRECMASHLPHYIEVYGLFSHLMPAMAVQEGGELQYARARQGGSSPRLPPPPSNPTVTH